MNTKETSLKGCVGGLKYLEVCRVVENVFLRKLAPGGPEMWWT
jgi:hypothetical protein